MSTDPLELRDAILTPPLSMRGVVDAALAACTAADLAALRSWCNAGIVNGDWRRVAVNRRIVELERMLSKEPQ
jgi:hypothetical protein